MSIGSAALYVADGAVVNLDGTLAVGAEAIRDHLAGLILLGGVMESINEYSYINGDLALIGARWSIAFDDGRPEDHRPLGRGPTTTTGWLALPDRSPRSRLTLRLQRSRSGARSQKAAALRV